MEIERSESPGQASRVTNALLLMVLVGVTVLAGGYLVVNAQNPPSQPSNGGVPPGPPAQTIAATTFQVQMLNNTVRISPGSSSVLLFQITNTEPATFVVGLLPANTDNIAVLYPYHAVSLPNGLQATLPNGREIAGSSLRVAVIISSAMSSSAQSIPLKLVVYKVVGATYLGTEVDFQASVA